MGLASTGKWGTVICCFPCAVLHRLVVIFYYAVVPPLEINCLETKACPCRLELFSPARIYDNFGEILAALNVFSLGLCAFLHFKVSLLAQQG